MQYYCATDICRYIKIKRLPAILIFKVIDTSENPAPTWLSLASESQLAILPVDETVELAVAIAPPNLLVDGNYAFKARITADNAAQIDVPIFVTVTGSDVGNFLFKAADVYTGTSEPLLDEYDQPILDEFDDPIMVTIDGLEGARIKLIHEVTNLERTEITNDVGEYLFEDMPVGRYIYRASKSGHNDLTGRIQIKPEHTGYEYVFITQNFISIEWSVTETSIIDRYEIVMNLTFETNVPAAVIVIEPVNTNLPDMYPGDVFSGVLSVTNEGLVRGYDFNLHMPVNDEYFSYELLAEVPTSIEAKETLYLPYRIINHKSLVPGADGDAGGGGCANYSSTGWGECQYDCADANNTTVGSASPFNVSYRAGSDCGGGSGGGGGLSGDSGGGTFACGGRPFCLGGEGVESSSSQCAPECEGSESCCGSEGS